jgi:hypothetical protein
MAEPNVVRLSIACAAKLSAAVQSSMTQPTVMKLAGMIRSAIAGREHSLAPNSQEYLHSRASHMMKMTAQTTILRLIQQAPCSMEMATRSVTQEQHIFTILKIT